MSYTDPQIGTLTISGDPARFVATERVPVSGVSMDFEPVQDLHGYEYPWPDGGGKNILALGSIITSNASYKEKTDNSVTIYSSLETPAYRYVRFKILDAAPYAGKTVTFSLKGISIQGTSVPRCIGRLYSADGTVPVGSTIFELVGTSVTKTFTFSDTIEDGVIMCLTLYSDSNNGGSYEIRYYDIQLEEGSTATYFVPFSNICPITGRDSVNVYVSPEPSITDGTKVHTIEFPVQGKNLLDITQTSYVYESVSISDNRINIAYVGAGSTSRVYFSQTFDPGTYTFSAKYTGGLSGLRVWSDKEVNGWTYNAYYKGWFKELSESITFNIPASARFGIIGMTATAGSTATIYDIMLQNGTIPTSYEPYKGRTVYAGTLTINEDGSGQIVSTMSMVDLGTLTWNYDGRFYATLTQSEQTYQKQTQNAFCNRYKWSNVYNNGNGTFYISENHNLSIWDSSYTDTATFKAMLTANNAQLVYELAEPVTIQLDPIEITTLIGLNYVWTSDNNLITITFPYNKEVQPMALSYDHCWTYPKAYIDKLEARIAALETAAAEAKTTAAPAETRETVAEDITVTEEPETEPVTKKGGK